MASAQPIGDGPHDIKSSHVSGGSAPAAGEQAVGRNCNSAVTCVVGYVSMWWGAADSELSGHRTSNGTIFCKRTSKITKRKVEREIMNVVLTKVVSRLSYSSRRSLISRKRRLGFKEDAKKKIVYWLAVGL